MIAFILLFLSLLIIFAFFIGRRTNKKKLIRMGKILERLFKPKDKLYTKLGDVVGFKAEYKTEDFRKVEITYLLLPRQSILFLPFSLIFVKKDRLYLLIKYNKKFKDTVHLIKKPMKEIKEMKWKIYKKIKKFYYISNIDNLLIKSLADFKDLRHVALYKNHLYVSMYSNGTTETLLSRIIDVAYELKEALY